MNESTKNTSSLEVYARGLILDIMKNTLVHMPSDDGGYIKFFLITWIKMRGKPFPKVLVNTIVPTYPKGWICKEINRCFKDNIRLQKLVRSDVLFLNTWVSMDI